jgi:hypothetical protein
MIFLDFSSIHKENTQNFKAKKSPAFTGLLSGDYESIKSR